MNELFESFLQDRLYLKNVSSLTIKSYRQAFERFKKGGGAEASKQTVNDFVVYMRSSGLSPVTCNISIRSMNSFLSWLFECGHIREPLKIKQLRTEKKVIKPYSDTELSRIVSFRPNTLAQRRLHALLCTLVECGCRIDELLSLKRSDLDFDNLYIVVFGKGKKERIVPISVELRKVLFKFLRVHDFEFVFGSKHGKADYRSLIRQWRNLCGRLGIEYRGFHSLRHNYGLNFIKQGGDISELRRLLGHSSITTTAMYVNLQTEDLRRAHARTSILSRLR